ncbi:MAG: mycothiol synthase [Streptosporangiaceae bacterium]
MIQVRTSGSLPRSDAAAVLELVSEATDADGVSPLSEHVVLHLRYGGDPLARNVLLWYRGKLAGYAHLDPTDRVAGPAGEMVIRPAARRRGLGRVLGRALVTEAGGAGVRLWAHGDLPAAARLAAAVGFHRSRALWQMRRPLAGELGEPRLPAGTTVRTFGVGQDEEAWLAVNRRAFASHPEQGSWTRSDLELREREPWFDPAGFFLAERDGKLAGFHWTKVYGSPRPGAPAQNGAGLPAAAGRQREAIGEVYVVGVDPDERGTGLGRALTLIGVRYLRALGLAEVMLYVDETNTAAIGLYASLGFEHSGTDVTFSRGDPEPAPGG